MFLNESSEIKIDDLFEGSPDIIFRKLARVGNLGNEHNIYQKLLHIMNYIPIVTSNTLAFSFGEADMGKSYFYTNFLNLEKMGEFPTKAEWRGSKTGNSEAILQKNFLLLEEIKDNNISESDLGIIKDAITSKFFVGKNDKPQPTKTSIVIVFNEYTSPSSLRSMNAENIKKILPVPLREQAIWSRVKIFLPHYRNLIGEKNFLPTLNIDTEELKKYLFSLREFEILDEDMKIDDIKRKKENIQEVSCGFLKLLCPNKKLSQISSKLKEASIDLAKHFMGLGDDNFYPLLTDKTLELIAKFQGIEFSHNSRFYKLSESKFIIEDKDKEIVRVVAIDQKGCTENKDIFDSLKKNQKHFLEFTGHENDFQILNFQLTNNLRNFNEMKIDNWKVHKSLEEFRKILEDRKNIIYKIIIEEINMKLSENSYTIATSRVEITNNIINYGITDSNIKCLDSYSYNIQKMDGPLYFLARNEISSLFNSLKEFLKLKIRNIIYENTSISIKIILKKINSYLEENLKLLKDCFNFEILRIESSELIPDLKLEEGIIDDKIKDLIELKIKSLGIEKLDKDFIYYLDITSLEPKLISF